MISPPYTRIFRWFFRTSAHGKPRPPHQTATRSGRQPFAAGRQRVAKAPRSRGNPFLPAYAGQKFLPPGIPLGTKLSAEPRTRRKAARTLSALNFPVCVPSIRTCRLDGTFLPGKAGRKSPPQAGKGCGGQNERLRSAVALVQQAVLVSDGLLDAGGLVGAGQLAHQLQPKGDGAAQAVAGGDVAGYDHLLGQHLGAGQLGRERGVGGGLPALPHAPAGQAGGGGAG